MMRIKELGVLCLIVAVILGLSLDVSGQGSEGDMCIPMGVVTIQAPEGVEATKAAVDFPHSAHFATDCKVCHHKWTGQEPIQGCMSNGCHDGIKAPETSAKYLSYSDVAIKYFKYAFHQACIGCHKEIKTRNMALEKSYQVEEGQIQPAGPSGCIECHPK
jgi:hypothetical protein